MNNIVKILVLSDIHGNTKILQKIIDNVEHDYSIIAGDFTCDDSIINKYINFAVRGNNDWNSSFKDELDFEINGIKFHLEHGHLIGSYSQLDNYEFMHKVLIDQKCDILIHGHTHIPKIFEYKEGLVMNPGSTTFPRGGSNASYAIITINQNKIVECEIIDIK
ncbi:metallophosphoesterase family protein [Mesomycoplasma moatsii]|uniref:metallophosphoesterase family protein n=1 Tax=Mesomycoplasma moatsii TaxID=171287 RepID=UPI0003B41D21